MEALKERGLLRQNAPHLVHDLAFVVPNYAWWEAPFYGIGMKVYDMLAANTASASRGCFPKKRSSSAFPPSNPRASRRRPLLRRPVRRYPPADRSRSTAADHGATLLNYCPGHGSPAQMATDPSTASADSETAKHSTIRAGRRQRHRRLLPIPSAARRPGRRALIAPSQGIHLVLDRSFLPGDTAIMVPHTSDGRVLFAIPWHGHALVGTTDTPIEGPTLDPLPSRKRSNSFSTPRPLSRKPPTRTDILIVFAGIRPLVKAGDETTPPPLARSHPSTSIPIRVAHHRRRQMDDLPQNG